MKFSLIGQEKVTFKYKGLLKGEFAVVPTDKLRGRSLSSKIPVDMYSIFMKLYVT